MPNGSGELRDMTQTPRKDERLSMNRRTVLKQLGATSAVTAVGASGIATADEDSTDYQNPIGPRHFGDPTVIQSPDGTYYVYGTGMVMAKSQDLVNWEPMGEVLTGEDVEWRDVEEGGLWAPNINYYNDQYYLYYSYSSWGSQDNPGIGLATAPDPEGPFTDQGPVFRSRDLPLTNTIDPTMVVLRPNEEKKPRGRGPNGGSPPGQGSAPGKNGTPYMVWGSYWGIHGVELTPDGQDYVPGTDFHMAGDMKEGPMMIPRDGYWYLLYSTGNCCAGPESTYGIEVGRSESFFGPYYTRDGRDLRNVDEHHEGTNILRGTSTFIGPGHNTAIQDEEGDWWMLYHVEANAVEEEWGRYMMLDPITWDDDGWPVVACDGVPSTQNPVPGSGKDICPSTDPAADSDYFRVVLVADDVEERLEPSEANYYEQQDVLIQQAIIDRDGVIEYDIEDVGRSPDRLESLPEEIREHFDYPGDGLQPIKVTNRVSVAFDIIPDEDVRLSFAIYTYPNDELGAEVESEQELVDSKTKMFPPADHRVALDLPWGDTGP